MFKNLSVFYSSFFITGILLGFIEIMQSDHLSVLSIVFYFLAQMTLIVGLYLFERKQGKEKSFAPNFSLVSIVLESMLFMVLFDMNNMSLWLFGIINMVFVYFSCVLSYNFLRSLDLDIAFTFLLKRFMTLNFFSELDNLKMK